MHYSVCDCTGCCGVGDAWLRLSSTVQFACVDASVESSVVSLKSMTGETFEV